MNIIKRRFIDYWNGQDDEPDYSKQYLTTEALSTGNITVTIPANTTTSDYTSISYSKNNGAWVETQNTNSSVTVTVPVVTGDIIRWKGIGDRMTTGEWSYSNFNSSAQFKIYGNIISLLYGDNFIGKTTFRNANNKNYCFASLFRSNSKLIDITNLILPFTESARFIFSSTFNNCTAITSTCQFPPIDTITDTYAYQSMYQGCTMLTYAHSLPATTIAGQSYERLFSGCRSLINSPAINATTLTGSYCCAQMFENCSSLITAPQILPATTLVNSCYTGMFAGCTALTTAPILPATRLASGCYSAMFNGCRSLVNAPALPATTLANVCYNEMFKGCTSLITAPVLSATTLANSCYSSMFNGCTSLTTAPVLPATNVWGDVYRGMFSGCTSLTTAPTLPATTLATNCYDSMFYGCTSLTTAPTLPATTLANYCYSNMFKGCTSLIAAPALPATDLRDYCYSSMFMDCSNLETAPELPAAILKNKCYDNLFYGCRKINYIKTLAETDNSGGNATTNWLYNVANTGTIDCVYPCIFQTNSVDGIPTGWTANYLNTNELLKFVCKSSNPVQICWAARHDTNSRKMIKYSTDGENWNTPSNIIDTTLTNDIYDMATLQTNDVLYIKGTNTAYSDSTGYSNYFVTKGVEVNGAIVNGELSVEGNIMSMIDEDNYSTLTTLTAGSAFRDLFKNCKHIKYADKLQLLPITLTTECYESMFKGCTSLTTAPELPATTLATNCYNNMFNGCTALTTTPELPATTLANSCYKLMFGGCTSLTTVSSLSATTLAESCYSNMFNGCTSLTTAPALPATTLATNCYDNMFYGCTSLTTAPALPATTLASHCYNSMFENCTSLITAPSLPANTLANYCYNEMFKGCQLLNEVFILANDISATDCLANWLESVAQTGTIYYYAQQITLPTDSSSGIPVGWTAIDISTLPEYQYLTIEALESGNLTFYVKQQADASSVSYRVNGGSWTTTTNPRNITITVPVSANDKVEWKGNATYYSNDYDNGSKFGGNVSFNASGNIMSMLYGDNFVGQYTVTGDRALSNFFASSNIISAENLVFPATSYTYNCCTRVFRNCSQLTTPPKELPDITTAGNYLFDFMFENCTALTKTPILRTKVLFSYMYDDMFKGCTNLNEIECHATNISAYRCTTYWTQGVQTTQGVFKGYASTNWPNGDSGIPNNWTFVDLTQS